MGLHSGGLSETTGEKLKDQSFFILKERRVTPFILEYAKGIVRQHILLLYF